MASDLRSRLQDAAGSPRFEVAVEELYGRALRARRRNAAIASGAVAVVVAVGAVVFALLPDAGPSPVITPTPPGDDHEDGDAVDDTDAPPTDEPANDPDDDPDAAPREDPAGDGSGLLDDVAWVVTDLDGLRDPHGQVLWETDGSPTSSAARDGEGGIVFTDATGLWWLPAGADEPEPVRDGQVGRIDAVVTVDGDTVVTTSHAGDVVLSSGEDADAELPPPEVLEPGESPPLTAANGLTAAVTPPEVERTPEGTIEQVIEPATLTIERDGEVELTVTVGTDSEPLVFLHDFDGRRVALTRAPEEPAMAPETVVVLDLDCPACVETLATSSPAGVALVGDDEDWDGPVQAPRQDLVTADDRR